MAAAISLAECKLRRALSAHYAAVHEEETAMGMWECACHGPLQPAHLCPVVLTD
jgi:hypothetical protein